MKKVKKRYVIILSILVFFGFIFAFIWNNMPKMQTISLTNASSIENGIYRGECDNKLVKVVVEVEVKEGKIETITILEHNNGLGSKAERIINDVIQKQSLEVEGISGATYSSSTILKAIENAIEQGKEE